MASPSNRERSLRQTVCLFVVLLVVSGSLTGAATGINTTQNNENELQTNSQRIVGAEQNVSISPDRSEITAGVTYTFTITIGVESGYINPKIQRPKMRIEVENGNLNWVSPTQDTYITKEKGSSQAILQSGPNTFFRGATDRVVLVSVTAPPDLDPQKELKITAIPGDKDNEEGSFNDGNAANKQYSVDTSDSDPNSAQDLAQAARARAQIAEDYISTYDALILDESWKSQTAKAIRDASVIATSKIISSMAKRVVSNVAKIGADATTSSKVNKNLDSASSYRKIKSNTESIYKLTQNKYPSSPVGKLARINHNLHNDLVKRVKTGNADSVGDVRVPLREFTELARAEAKAWEEGNKERARELLYKQSLVLNGAVPQKDLNAYRSSLIADSEVVDPYVVKQAGEQSSGYIGLEEGGAPDRYFESVKGWARSEVVQIRETLLPIAKDPNPVVTTERNIPELRQRLRERPDRFTVSFNVNNKGGYSSRDGYLSVSHASNLEIISIQSSGEDSETPTIINVSAGDDVISKDGNKIQAEFPLTDILESYTPGETNTYSITFERQGSGPSWFSYRAAFKPLLSENSQASFARFPRQSEYPADQQGWNSINVTESDPSDSDDHPPTARIDASQLEIQTGERVVLDGSNSTDDTGIESYEWFKVTDEGEEKAYDSGKETDFSSDSPTTETFALRVTDQAGNTATRTVDIRVNEAPTPDADLYANRQHPQPGDTVSFRAVGEAANYAWDLDGDGNFDDGSGKSVSKSFSSGGEYSISLRVTNAAGQSDTDALLLRVRSPEERVTTPKISLNIPEELTAGETGRFDASNSSDKAVSSNDEIVDGTITEYRWDFDDDGQPEANGSVVERSFDTAGQKTVQLTVTDDDGNTVTATRTLAVEDRSSSDSGGIGNSPDWPMFGDGPSNDGNNSESVGPTENVTEEWFSQIGPVDASSPAVVDGTLYIGSEDGRLYTLDAETGQKGWEFQTGSDIFDTSPAVINSTVYIGTGNGKMYALDAKTGKQRWVSQVSVQSHNHISSSPVVVNGTVYFGSDDGQVYALDAQTGKKRWAFQAGSFVYSSPAVINNTVYVLGGDGRMYALDSQTGKQRWEFQTGNSVDSSPAVVNGTVYIGDDGKLHALDAHTGEQRWEVKYGFGLSSSSPVVADGTVYIARNKVYALDAQTGEQEWVSQVGGGTVSRPAVADSIVYVSGSDRRVHALDAQIGEQLWTSQNGVTGGSGPVVMNGTVYTANNEGTVYALTGTGQPLTDGNQTNESSPPSAALTWRPAEPRPAEIIRFDASNSSDPDGEIVEYRWDFDSDGTIDNTTTSPTTTEHPLEYESQGDHKVTVTVVDNQGATDSVSKTITVSVEGSKNLGADWHMSGDDPTNTGDNSESFGPVDNVSVQWVTDVGGATGAAVVDETVYTGGEAVTALDAETGQERWTYDIDSSFRSAPAVVDDTVYIGNNNNNLYALDAQSGEQQWVFEASGSVQSAPTVVDGRVYVGSNDGNLYAIDAETGTQQWAFETGRKVDTSPAVAGDTVYVTSTGSEQVYAVDATTGEEQWVYEGERFVYSPVVVNGNVYVSVGSQIHVLDARTGEREDAFETRGTIGASPAVANGMVYVGNGEEVVVVLNATTGEQQGRGSTWGSIFQQPTVVDETVYIGSIDAFPAQNHSTVYAFDAETAEKQWSFAPGDNADTSPVVVNGTVYVGSGDDLYALTETDEEDDEDGTSSRDKESTTKRSKPGADDQREGLSLFEIEAREEGEMHYRVIVEGSAEKTEVSEKIGASENDDIRQRDDGTAVIDGETGNVGYGDAYRIDGEIVDFQRVSGEIDVILRLDGNQIPVSELANSTPGNEDSTTTEDDESTEPTTPTEPQRTETTLFEIIAQEDGEMEYELVVDGEVEKAEVSEKVGASENDNIQRRDDGTVLVEGYTGNTGYGDAYRIDGDIIDYRRVSGDIDIILRLDGNQVPVSELSGTTSKGDESTEPQRTETTLFEIIAQEDGEMEYELVVGGEVEKTEVSEKVGASENDDIRQRDDGTVVIEGFTGNTGYGDAYRINGKIIDYRRVSGDIDVVLRLDGERTTVEDLSG